MKKFEYINFCFSVGLILLCQISFGQIKGRIINSSNKPLEGVNVLVLKFLDSSLVKGAITDDTGSFNIKLKDTGSFRLLITLIGYQELYTKAYINTEVNGTIDAGTITLSERNDYLTTVKVTTKKPFIERKTDRLVINIKNSIISIGNNVLDILKRMPGVTVDNNTMIKLKGKEGTVIYINNKPTYLSAEDLGDLLKSMDAGQIEKIEIISNPSAKYEASGNAGIINIILKKNELLGFNAQLNASYGLSIKGDIPGNYPDGVLGINANYKIKKFNFFANYSYKNNKDFWKADFTRIMRNQNSQQIDSIYLQNILKTPQTTTHYTNIGVDFIPGARQTIGFFINGVFTDMKSTTASNINMLNAKYNLASGLLTTSKEKNIKKNLTVNFNYNIKIDSSGKELSASMDYGKFNRDRQIQFVDKYYDKNEQPIGALNYLKGILPTNIKVLAGKIDYAQPVNKAIKIQTGIKSSYVTNNNDFKYLIDTNGTYSIDYQKTNNFRYTEYINAAYINYIQETSEKFNFSIGLRGEQTIGKGIQLLTNTSFTRKYLQVFPSASINWNSNANNKFGLSYSRRIDRPSYQDLNPFLFYFDPYTFYQGNPMLKPQLTNGIEFTHSYKNLVTTTLGYSRTKDVITQIGTQNDTSHLLYFTNLNLDKFDNYNLSFILETPVSTWWTSTNTISGYYDVYISELQGGQLSKRLFGYILNTQNDFKFKKGVSAEISAYFNSKSIYGISTVNPLGNISLGIKKELTGKGINIKIGYADIFWMERYKEQLLYKHTDVTLYSYTGTRKINLSLSWSFGKSKSRHVDRESGADEEINRVPK